LTCAAMALRGIPSTFSRLIIRDVRPLQRTAINHGRQASTEATVSKEPLPDFEDLESQSSLSSTGPSNQIIKTYDPVKRAQRRKKELPPSRYGLQLLCSGYDWLTHLQIPVSISKILSGSASPSSTAAGL
jgi:hypothetical protein